MRTEIKHERTRSGLPLCRGYMAVIFETVAVMVQRSSGSMNMGVHWAIGHTHDHESEVLGVWNRPNADLPELIGKSNTLGVLATPMPDQGAWRAAFDDLRDRGLERIRVALSTDLVNVREDLRGRFPGATALPSFAQLLERSTSRVAARHRAPVGECLRAIINAESGLAARAALAEFESSRWGASYPALVADWRLALEQGWALWSLALPLRRVVLSSDGVAAALNRSLCKAVGRHGSFAGAEAAASFVKAALAREQRRLDEAQVAEAAEHNHHREGSGSTIAVLGI
jgi:putative transposase